MAVLLVLLPLAAVVLLNLPLPRLMNRVALGLAALVCLHEAVIVLVAPQPSMPLWTTTIPIAAVLGSKFAADEIALVMFLSIGIVGAAAVLVGQYSLDSEQKRFRFANLLLLSVAGMNGIVLAQDLFLLYVFLEITAVASFILIAMDRGKHALEGAFKYMVLSAVGTALILAGIALFFMVAGGTSFGEVAAVLRRGNANSVAALATALFLGGLAIKAGLVPFHAWVPDAYAAAPSAVSVLLAGIITKTTGVYTLIRLVSAVFGYTTPVRNVLLITGTLSIVIGAVAALEQKDFKRMLAYSSISQVGYIILGLGAGSALGMAGAVLHLFNHAIFKTLLFVNSAAVEQQSGTRNMDELGGISSRMPVTGTTSVVAMLLTAGIPPLSGFWSKLIIIVAVWKADETTYAVIAILASLLTLAYFLSMQRRVFFGKLTESCAQLKEAGIWGTLPAIVLAAITVGVGVSVPWLFETFLLPIRSIL